MIHLEINSNWEFVFWLAVAWFVVSYGPEVISYIYKKVKGNGR